MNTLDDLRASLSAHADGLTDDGLTTRAGAVHVRIRRARRQRRAALAGGLAAVVAMVGIGVASTAMDQRSSLRPTGVPETVTVDGFDYHLDHTDYVAAGDGRLVVDLPKTSDRRVVMFSGTGLGAGTATLRQDGEDAQRLTRDGVEPAFSVSSDTERLTVRLDGTPATAQVSLSVFTRTPGQPVYRQRIGDSTLLAHGTAQGTSTLTFSFTSAGGQVGWATTCNAPGVPHARMRLSIDGDGGIESGCDDGAIPEDAGANITTSMYVAPGEHTVTMSVLSRGRTAAHQLPGAALSAGAYNVSLLSRSDVPRQLVPSMTEDYGRWYAADPAVLAHGTTTITPTEPVLVTMIGTSHGTSRIGVTTSTGRAVDTTWSATEGSGGGRPWSREGILLPGETYRLRLEYGARSRHDAAILLYRPVAQ